MRRFVIETAFNACCVLQPVSHKTDVLPSDEGTAFEERTR